MKSKGKARVEVVADLAKGRKKSKMRESEIAEVVDSGILQSHVVIQWRPAEEEDRPYEATHEIVLFRDFVERALAIPTSDFLYALLKYWGIQLHHLTPQSILHLSIFSHLCEAFLAVEPYFHLFQHFFCLRPHTSANKPVEVGGAENIL